MRSSATVRDLDMRSLSLAIETPQEDLLTPGVAMDHIHLLLLSLLWLLHTTSSTSAMPHIRHQALGVIDTPLRGWTNMTPNRIARNNSTPLTQSKEVYRSCGVSPFLPTPNSFKTSKY